MDITQLILDDRDEQRRLFAMLEQIDRTDAGTLATVCARLAAFLDLHAEAEEQLFYPALLHLGRGVGGKHAPDEETEDAIHDHNDIRDAVAEVAEHAIGSDGWYAAVAAAKANGDHMAEEERQGLTDFRRHVSLQTRHDLGSKLRISPGRAAGQGPAGVHRSAPARRRLGQRRSARLVHSH